MVSETSWLKMVLIEIDRSSRTLLLVYGSNMLCRLIERAEHLLHRREHRSINDGCRYDCLKLTTVVRRRWSWLPCMRTRRMFKMTHLLLRLNEQWGWWGASYQLLLCHILRRCWCNAHNYLVCNINNTISTTIGESTKDVTQAITKGWCKAWNDTTRNDAILCYILWICASRTWNWARMDIWLVATCKRFYKRFMWRWTKFKEMRIFVCLPIVIKFEFMIECEISMDTSFKPFTAIPFTKFTAKKIVSTQEIYYLRKKN